MSGLLRMDGGGAVLPFVRQFYGRPSSYLWDDEDGQVHEIVQGEGGEQGDPLMPALFALGQHAALVAVQDTLLPSEKLFAFLDDIYAVVKPERVAEVHASLERELWVHARIHIHQGKTQFWNHGGIEPPDCQRIYAAARAFDPNFVVWRGDATLPTEDQGVTILGTPLGHPDFVEASLQAKSREHDTLFDRLVAVPDLQCAWLLLLFCASTRANYMLRMVHPELSHGFATRHDSRVWSTLTRLLGVEGSECARQRASLPFSIGGLGLRSVVRTSTAAYWSSWADTLSMIRARHPTVADDVVIALSANLGGLHLQGANSCRRRLQDAGFDVPEWGDLSRGLRPGQRGLDDAP